MVDRGDAGDGVRSFVAVALAILALWATALVSVGHARDVTDMKQRLPDLGQVGVVAVAGRWSPVPDDVDTLVSVTVIPGSAGTGDATGEAAPEESDPAGQVEADIGAVLVGEGFEPWSAPSVYRRPSTGDEAGEGRYDVAVVGVGDDGAATVRFARSPLNGRDLLPLALYLTTAGCVVALYLAAPGSSARELIGGVVLVLTVLQFVLLVRGLWLAERAVAAFIDERGPLTPSVLADPGNQPGLAFLNHQVTALARPVHPFGAATVVVLAPFWLVACLITLGGYRRAAPITFAVGVVLGVCVMVAFGRSAGVVVDVLKASGG